MPRYRRQIAAGSTQHLISRFVDRAFRLDAPGARDEYLRRAGLAFARCDWRALGFALMSSHVHWTAVAGRQPSSALVKPLHAGFARWLNDIENRLGPVFAQRHRSATINGETAAAVLAYIHNNPVRAGVVTDPADTSWTSHRAYLGLAPAPPWLDVELGLHLCGYSAAPSGRLAFHEMVQSRALDPRSTALSSHGMRAHRRRARERLAAPVEIATPTIRTVGGDLEIEVPVVAVGDGTVRPRWDGHPSVVVRAVQNATGVGLGELTSRCRPQRVSHARRLAMLVWTQELQRPALQMSQCLGISSSSASYLTSTASSSDQVAAEELGRSVRLTR